MLRYSQPVCYCKGISLYQHLRSSQLNAAKVGMEKVAIILTAVGIPVQILVGDLHTRFKCS
ncbi:hypothetical protein ACT691_08600 [Vibrio metschnikovii]